MLHLSKEMDRKLHNIVKFLFWLISRKIEAFVQDNTRGFAALHSRENGKTGYHSDFGHIISPDVLLKPATVKINLNFSKALKIFK